MKLKLIVEGGAMKPGPAVAQQLGPMGINLGKVIEDVNKETSGFKGMKVPVELDVDPRTKNYKISVLSPPASEMIKQELKIEKASGKAGSEWVGNIAFETVLKVAKQKQSGLLAKNLKTAVKLILGSCVSLGVLVDSKSAKEIVRGVESGNYDDFIEQEKTEVDPAKKKELENYFAVIKAEQEKKAKAAEAAKAAEEAAKTAAATAAPAEGEKKDDSAKKEVKKEEPKKEEKKKK